MKTYYKYTIFFSVALMFLASCSKDFLNKPSKLSQTNELQLSTYSNLKDATYGVYGYLCATDWYGRNFIVEADLKGGNAKLSPVTSGRFTNDFIWNHAADNTINTWEYAYKAIAASNNIINTIDGGFSETGVSADDLNLLKGECLFLRALSYFDMIRLYSQPYIAGRDNLGVPIVLVTENGYPARNTVGEVFDQIVIDLKSAENLLLPVNPKDAAGTQVYATNFAAKALLAKVYLYMGNWQEAANYATDVIKNGGFSLFTAAQYTSYDKDGYWGGDGTGSEIIFQVDGSESNSQHGYWDAISYIVNPSGYGDIGTSKDLLNLYSIGDVRANLFRSIAKYPTEFWTMKYPGRLGSIREYDVPVLRIAEMYLIRSEAILNNASISGVSAVSDFNAIQVKRGLTAVSAISLNDIYLERRRELCFEANELFDLARTQRSLTRTDFNGSINKDVTFLKGGTAKQNYLWAMPIPIAEINANKNIVQNPEY